MNWEASKASTLSKPLASASAKKAASVGANTVKGPSAGSLSFKMG